MKAGRGCLIALALALLAGPCFADAVSDLLTVGKKAFSGGQYTLAIRSFQRIASEYPESPSAEEAEYMLGVSQFYAGNSADSLAALGAFRAHHPESGLLSRCMYWTAAASVRLGKYDEALGCLAARPPTADDPYRGSALLLTGVAQEALGRDPDAAAAFRSIVADPGSATLAPEAVYRLAGIDYRAARFALARDQYSRVLIVWPESPFVRDSVFFLAECELALGNLDEARKRYGTVLSLYPDSPYREASLYRIADIAWRKKDAEAANAALDALTQAFPDGDYRGTGLRLRADILLAAGKYDAALAQYAQAIGALLDGPEKQAAWYAVGLAQLRQGKKSLAAASFAHVGSGGVAYTAERAAWQRALLLAQGGGPPEAAAALGDYLRAYPSGPSAEQAGSLLASLLEKEGDEKGALERWDAQVRSYPRSASFPEYLFRRGNALVAAGQEAAGLDDLQRVLKTFPKSPWRNESAYSIGWVYVQRGEYPRALPYFQSVASDPKAAEAGERARLSVGVTLFNMGSFDKALAALQALMDARPASVPRGRIALYMGRALYRMERLADAGSQLASAAKDLSASSDAQAASEAADARWWLAWSLLRQGKAAEARDAFLQCAGTPTDPRRAEAFFRAGVACTQLKDDASALGYFDKSLELPATDVREQALYEKAWALSRLGRSDASEAFARLEEEFPDGKLAPQAWFTLGEKALDALAFAAAHDDFAHVATAFPKSPLALQSLYWAGEALRRAGDERGAMDAFWACLIAGPEAGALVSTLDGFGEAVRALGDPEAAKTYADRAAATSGLSVEAAAGVRLAYAGMLLTTDPGGALELAKAVRATGPAEPWAGESDLIAGRAYAGAKDWQRALDTLGALEGSRADEIGARAGLERAGVLEAMGHTAEAVDEFTKISYLFADFPDLAAEGLYNAARVARARGDSETAGSLEATLRKSYPQSPWTAKIAPPAQ